MGVRPPLVLVCPCALREADQLASPFCSCSVARVGGLDGVWSKDARKEVARLFNVTASAKVGVVSAFDRQVRDTVQWDTLSSTLSGMGLDEPMSTQYRWASLDGALPRDHGDVHSRTEVNLDVCFGAFWTKRADTSAVEIFTRIAFLHHECGDKSASSSLLRATTCTGSLADPRDPSRPPVIAALINASGPAGLSAFLPAAGTVLPISDPLPTEVQPHMPLTKTWRGTDFNLRAVVQSHEAEVDVRAWVLRLLARYQYTSGASGARPRPPRLPRALADATLVPPLPSAGNSEYEFAMIHHAVDMLSVLKVDADGSRIASLAINDDLEGSDEEIEDGAQAIKCVPLPSRCQPFARLVRLLTDRRRSIAGLGSGTSGPSRGGGSARSERSPPAPRPCFTLPTPPPRPPCARLVFSHAPPAPAPPLPCIH